MSANIKTYTFHVNGMHCKSCALLIENELSKLSFVSDTKVSFADKTAMVAGDFGVRSEEEIVKELSDMIVAHGYNLSVEKQIHEVRWSDFYYALPIAVAFIGFFILLQKLGVVNLIKTSDVGYGTAAAIGLIASVSTCMAVVGGLILSVAANFAKEGSKYRPQIFFHAGRLVSFFVLGGIVGAVGSSLQLGGTGIFILGFLVGAVMLILGINLLDIFPWVKKLQPTLPGFISKHLFQIKEINHTLMPVLLGAITFFLPCGFTQSMQIYALTMGSFIKGAMIMFSFALGTLPVLLLLSFGSAGIKSRGKTGIFFKAAGLVVIFFALFNIINSLVATGFIPPLFNF
ncbi:MAG: Uncharacterized protein CEN90_398 [Parcubacteria group bacterium Licking1014_17]|nr:MAG: Uncharacterized protein CEN90_398 [Parcubacteria group bacterium Licking1014_17]